MSAWASPITRRVLLFLLVGSVAVATLLIAVELALEHRRDVAVVDALLQEIRTSRLPAISETVWVANERLIESQLQGLVSLTVIEKAEIIASEGARYAVGTIRSRHTTRRTYPITYVQDQTVRRLGSLDVVIGLDRIDERAYERLIVVGLAQLIKTLFIFASAFLILWVLVVRHVHALTSYTDRLGLGVPEVVPALSRRGRAGRDELDALSDAIVDMAARTWQAHLQSLAETRRRLEADRERALAEQAIEAKGAFLANMSHELRTPLNGILGFSQMLEHERFGTMRADRVREYAAYIHRAGRTLLGLVDDILEFSEIEAGRLVLRPAGLSLPELLGAVIRQQRDAIDARGLQIVLHCPPELPALWADTEALTRIVRNLLSNAVKFTPPGGRITVAARLDAAGHIRLSVGDTGIGIARELRERILEPFELGETCYSRTTGGAGLGLAQVKGLAQLHGASLEIDSEAGMGTTVTVLFPADRTVTGPAAELPAPVPAVPA